MTTTNNYDHGKHCLEHAVKNTTCATSYLISGVRGVGKEQLARYLAKILNCDEQAFDDACQCRACRRIAAGSHPDVMFVDVLEDEQSIIIEQVRALTQWMCLKPYEASYKVAIIREAERMTEEAQNALLKSLEEPPAHTVVCLTAVDPLLLLPTIRSRVMEIRVTPPSVVDLATDLQQKNDELGKAAYYVVHAAHGSPDEAQKLIDAGVVAERADVVNAFMNGSIMHKLREYEPAKRSEAALVELRRVANMLLFLARDLLVLTSADAATVDGARLINRDYEVPLRELAPRIDREDVVAAIDLLQQTDAYLEKGNLKLFITALCVVFNRISAIPMMRK